jgi:hypothetical protein
MNKNKRRLLEKRKVEIAACFREAKKKKTVDVFRFVSLATLKTTVLVVALWTSPERLKSGRRQLCHAPGKRE